MPLYVPQILLALAIMMTAVAGIWLLVNARAVARLFRSTGIIEPGPGPRRASRRAVVVALVAFNIGWIGSIAIWSWAMSDDAPMVVDTQP
ncbi:hypothetical protein FHS61_001239 [Altererythrobacter atlanticus]|uniref:Uncharacterized protein n=1 Tax=Croceibacterium atlanticum TaxID=1267766 RepID=A0A0F7KUZ9_9SPHN|nr:hypothetical protein [Croceibacterium atlanticum]AKH43062.1 hypothetical protein WYH_02028 [Croceibacterium atlanticum]MBB5732235.1 hypothetical protein [Croceibacterium atlanticum]